MLARNLENFDIGSNWPPYFFGNLDHKGQLECYPLVHKEFLNMFRKKNILINNQCLIHSKEKKTEKQFIFSLRDNYYKTGDSDRIVNNKKIHGRYF